MAKQNVTGYTSITLYDLYTDSKNSVFRRKCTEYRKSEYRMLTLLFGGLDCYFSDSCTSII